MHWSFDSTCITFDSTLYATFDSTKKFLIGEILTGVSELTTELSLTAELTTELSLTSELI